MSAGVYVPPQPVGVTSARTPAGCIVRFPTDKRATFRLDYSLGGHRHQPGAGPTWEGAWLQALEADKLLAAENGQLAERPLADLVEAWTGAHELSWTTNTKRDHDKYLPTIVQTLGHIALVDLKREDIRKMLNACKPSERAGRVRKTVRAMLVWGKGNDWVPAPIADLMPAREKAELPLLSDDDDESLALGGGFGTYIPEGAAPNNDEVWALIDAAGRVETYAEDRARAFTPPAHWQLLFMVAAFCGLRQGEVFALRGRDVLNDGQLLFVRRQLIETTGYAFPQWAPPKQSSTRRAWVPQARLTRGVNMHALLVARAEEVGPDGLLFPSLRGLPWRKSGFFKRVWAPAKKAAWGEDSEFVFHGTRHHFCRWAFDLGVAPADVAEFTGHKQLTTLLNMYVSSNSGAVERANAVGTA